MADVRPFRALRYAPELDLATAVCPPFDTISPEQQRALHDLSPCNAVRIELAFDSDGDRYWTAAAALQRFRDDGTLRRDSSPCFYLYDQTFERDGRTHTRRILFARLRLEPWGGAVLPHEQTFGGPKADRLKLLRATRLNASPVFLVYRDAERRIGAILARAGERPPDAQFTTPDGQQHTLRLIDDPEDTNALSQAFRAETLCVADGHHRYETALGYRDERRSAAATWTGDEPENFALIALSAASDPGLLVLPIHRVTNAAAPLDEALGRLRPLFDIETIPSLASLESRLAGAKSPAFGLAAAESPDLHLLTVREAAAVDALLPQDRSPEWRGLDYAIANYAVLRHALGLTDAQMSGYGTLWFTEDAGEAVRTVRSGKAHYAVLLHPVAVTRVLDLAAAGERMPQKSTFFYPKVPTGLVFNPLED